ncbi:TPA: ParA family protein, partial [Escherichia coli]
VTMHSLACELLPEWREFFDALLENGGKSLWAEN